MDTGTTVRRSPAWWFGILLLAIMTLVVVSFYGNMPALSLDPDTPAYIGVARKIVHHGFVIDPNRMPGYPVFIIFVLGLAGKTNLQALGYAQAALYILAVIELYILLLLMFRRPWAAFLVAALSGANIVIVSYVKALLSEGLTLVLVTSLALAVTLFIRSTRPVVLWLVAMLMLALFLTRPEWMYLPPLLFGFLLLIAYRRGMLRRLLPHAAAGLAVLYLALGFYIVANGVQNGYYGVTRVQTINLLGKVMQYHMQNEAPPQYAKVAEVVNQSVSRGITSPWAVIFRGPYPPLRSGNYGLAAQYSTAIIKAHPIEFLGHSFVLGWQSFLLIGPFRPIPPVFWLPAAMWLSTVALTALITFPVLAVMWWVLLFRHRTAGSRMVEMMCALSLLAFYGLVITTLGTYTYYTRMHAPFDLLMGGVVWGTLVICAILAYRRIAPPRPYFKPDHD